MFLFPSFLLTVAAVYFLEAARCRACASRSAATAIQIFIARRHNSQTPVIPVPAPVRCRNGLRPPREFALRVSERRRLLRRLCSRARECASSIIRRAQENILLRSPLVRSAMPQPFLLRLGELGSEAGLGRRSIAVVETSDL